MGPKKVSALVSLFEHGHPTSPESTDAAPLPRPAPRTQLYLPPPATLSPPSRLPARTGSVSSHVQRFSANADAPPVLKQGEGPDRPVVRFDKAFKPRREAPVPPGGAPTVLVPAHIVVAAGGGQRKVEMAKREEQRPEEVLQVVREDPPTPTLEHVLPAAVMDAKDPFDDEQASAVDAALDEAVTTNPSILAHPLDALPTSPPAARSSPLLPSPRSSAGSFPSFFTRPPLQPHGTSSYSSTHTVRLPAATLFHAGSAPLDLPNLDRHLQSLEPVDFSDIDEKGLLSRSERVSWRDWVTRSAVEKKPWYRRWWGTSQGGVADAEKQRLTGDAIFPPMDLLDGRTVTDLKYNKGVPLLSFDAALGLAIDGILAGEDSSYGISLTQVELFRDVVQMVALLVQHIVPSSTTTLARSILVVPKVLAGDFPSAFGFAILWLWIFSAIASFAVYEIYRFSGGWHGIAAVPECTSGPVRWRDSRRWKVLVTFTATTLYLPLSKIAVDCLTWSSDLWQTGPPESSPALYDAADFCYRTTMRRGGTNFAFVIVAVAACTFLWISVFLPYRLYCIVDAAAPHVDHYNELGDKRKDREHEYERLLDRDSSPFAFLYNAYRRPYSAFKTVYMLIKLFSVLLSVLFSTKNCLFATSPASRIDVVREGMLLLLMGVFLLTAIVTEPFLLPATNRSDVVSRCSFVIVAALGLWAALAGEEAGILGGALLYAVLGVTYALNGWLALVSVYYVQSVIKRLQSRIDFSLDVFSPRLDLARHLSARIWRETLSLLLLASEEFAMPPDALLQFKRGEHQTAPRLQDFRGTVAERHVENIQILRAVGLETYAESVRSLESPPHSRISHLRRTIALDYTGPDIAFSSPNRPLPVGITSIFGRLEIAPFPFVCVFRYDQDPESPLRLSEEDDLEMLVLLNSSRDVQRRVRIRHSLRALEGQQVFAPYTRERLISATSRLFSFGRRKNLSTRIDFRYGTLKIARNTPCLFQGYNSGSGFAVSIEYSDGESTNPDGSIQRGLRTVLSGYELGLTDEFRLTPAVAQLLRHNRETVETRIGIVEEQLRAHRDYDRLESTWKQSTLSYASLLRVLGETSSLSRSGLGAALDLEPNPLVRQLVYNHSGAITYLYERLATVSLDSSVRAWWYVFWDELWRKNGVDLRLPSSFSPHYRDSICYRPMSRLCLEEWLAERGFWVKGGRKGCFHSGLLNKIYFYLDEMCFDGTAAISIRVGATKVEYDTLAAPPVSDDHNIYPSLATSIGTNIDDAAVRLRHAYTFEEVFDPPSPRFVAGQRGAWLGHLVNVRARGVLLVWLGLRPVVHSSAPHDGVTFDLRRGKLGWEMPRERIGRADEALIAASG